MEEKLRRLMKHEGINSTRLAEILGIQASGISHIMSGRNKPSFDFLLKLLQRFPQINPDWLMLDKGPMYRDEIKSKDKTGIGNGVGTGAGFANSSDVRTSGFANLAGQQAVAPEQQQRSFTGTIHQTAANIGPTRSAATISDSANNPAATSVNNVSPVVGHYPGVANRGLFGPDNNDIIPSGGQQGQGYGRLAGHQQLGVNYVVPQADEKYSGRYSSSDTFVGASSGQTSVGAMQQAVAPEQQLRPFTGAMHQTAANIGLTRSASIERIVVFYKDKTFSEYQPEA